MDPRLRLLLMSTWRTLEDAAIDPESPQPRNTGVFIGCETNEYAQLMARQGFVPHMGLSQADSMIANRISYQFDFSGPSELVNATCAGFAVALHRAVVALRAGLIDRAIVGAAHLMLLPDAFIALSKAEQLTPQPTVKSFGQNGDGFIRAEGVGTVLIERLQTAESDHRPIYAVLKHTAVNFNGRGGVSMASPNIEAHVALMKMCYREAGIDPRHLTYVEAQGMGLPVADIAEWTAINRALKELCEEKDLAFEPRFCRVSTLKPLTGHMHAASSLGALLKIIRSFQTGKIHKIPDYTAPNDFCDMQETPCCIAEKTEPWPEINVPRLAALHAYGSGGNNAHVLLEEYRGELRVERDRQENRDGRAFDATRCWFPSDAVHPSPLTDRHDEEVLKVVQTALGLDAKHAGLGIVSRPNLLS